MSTYTAFDNNPVFWADPSGADAETMRLQGLDGKWHTLTEGVDYVTVYKADDQETDPKKKKKKKKKKKSKKKAVKDMSAGEFYAKAYTISGGGYIAAMDGRDPYSPTKADEIEANSRLGNALFIAIPIGRALKIIRLGKYSRAAYHKGLSVLKKHGDDLLSSGKTYEEVVKVLSPARNMLKATIRKSDSWIGRKIAEIRNLYKYGDKLGPKLDHIIGKYTKDGVTNWKAIYDKIWRTSTTFDKLK